MQKELLEKYKNELSNLEKEKEQILDEYYLKLKEFQIKKIKDTLNKLENNEQ